MNDPVVIVGAGLSGLRDASLLTAHGINCKVLEARDRTGGRILTAADPNKPDLGKFDFGPTWFWPQYERTIANLVKELDLETFVEYTKGVMLSERFPNEPPERYELPENSGPISVRFRGGV